MEQQGFQRLVNCRRHDLPNSGQAARRGFGIAKLHLRNGRYGFGFDGVRHCLRILSRGKVHAGSEMCGS